MSGLVVLIPIALLLGVGALATFLWALRSGQYEDLKGAAERVLQADPKDPRVQTRSALAQNTHR